MTGTKRGELCGVEGCEGFLDLLPPIFFEEGCFCSVTHPPCGWCEGWEVRCNECARLPDEIVIESVGDAMTGETLRGALESSLVSLDIQPQSCQSDVNILRINPELHFPLNEVFEVPDEFNGHQRGTFYYRNGRGVLRGPFMNAEEAGFDLCRRTLT